MTTRRTFIAAGLACAAAPARAQPGGPYAAAAAYSDAREGVSFLVMQAGAVRFEHYAGEGGPDRAWELASGTKSFSGVLAAALVKDGALALDEPVSATLPEWRAEADKKAVTIRQLLTLTSGLPGGAIGRPPVYADAVASPLRFAPGARFQYGPAPFQVFGELVRRKTNRDVYDLLVERLLAPIGVRPARWRRGEDGNPHLPSGAALTARDWAAFGRFVAEGGRGLLDAKALAACFEGTAANPGYGLTWWLLRQGLVGPDPRSGIAADMNGPIMAEDVRMAAGLGNQRLYLLPKRDLLVVRQARIRLARGRGADWSDAAFLRLVLEG